MKVMPRVDVIDLFEKRKVYRSFIKNPEGQHLPTCIYYTWLRLIYLLRIILKFKIKIKNLSL